LPTDNPQGCLFSLLRLFGIGRSHQASNRTLPYRRKDFLMSKAEASFFGVLSQALAGEFFIFVKIRLADLLYLPRGTAARQSHFNRIQSKHVDFVLCHRDGIRPCLAIELDDSSHERADRVSRDDFVVRALSDAGLPLLRVRASRSYDVAQLRQEIRDAIRLAH
jgi:hypothetical protein